FLGDMLIEYHELSWGRFGGEFGTRRNVFRQGGGTYRPALRLPGLALPRIEKWVRCFYKHASQPLVHIRTNAHRSSTFLDFVRAFQEDKDRKIVLFFLRNERIGNRIATILVCFH